MKGTLNDLPALVRQLLKLRLQTGDFPSQFLATKVEPFAWRMLLGWAGGMGSGR